MNAEEIKEAVSVICSFEKGSEERQIAKDLTIASMGGKKTTKAKGTARKTSVHTLLRKGVEVKASLSEDGSMVVFEGEGLEAKNTYSVQGLKEAYKVHTADLWKKSGYLPDDIRKELGEGWSKAQTELCLATPEVAEVLAE